MYPQFIAQAENEGNKAAAMSFKNANTVEEIHHGLYAKALEAVQGGDDLPESAIYVCGICGNTALGEAPERCPVCGAPKARFSEIA
jgi:rubrerythrin